jgi:hypothetical protein
VAVNFAQNDVPMPVVVGENQEAVLEAWLPVVVPSEAKFKVPLYVPGVVKLMFPKFDVYVFDRSPLLLATRTFRNPLMRCSR